MLYTFGGLVLATIFGMFFGSEGEMEPLLVSVVFWGLIGSGMFMHLLVIMKDLLCRKRSARAAVRREIFQRYFHC